MSEPLSVDYFAEEEEEEEEDPRPFDRLGFWEGVIIGASAFALVIVLRTFLKGQVSPSLSIDVAPQALFSCHSSGSLPLPDSLWVLSLWWLHLGLVQPRLLPATTAPSVPYLGVGIVFLIALAGLFSSSRGIRRTWITLGSVLLAIYIGAMLVYLLIVSMNICS